MATLDKKQDSSRPEFLELTDDGARLIVPTERFYKHYDHERILGAFTSDFCEELIRYLYAGGFNRTFFNGEAIQNALRGKSRGSEAFSLLGIVGQLDLPVIRHLDNWAKINQEALKRKQQHAARLDLVTPKKPYRSLKPNMVLGNRFYLAIEAKAGNAQKNYEIWPTNGINCNPVSLAVYDKSTFDRSSQVV